MSSIPRARSPDVYKRQGRGNVLFNIMGIFVIGIINNVLNLVGAPYQLQQIIQGVIIILAVVMSSPKRK